MDIILPSICFFFGGGKEMGLMLEEFAREKMYWVGNFFTHDGSMNVWYIYLHEWLIFMGFHQLGKYTINRPMDRSVMGNLGPFFSDLKHIRVCHGKTSSTKITFGSSKIWMAGKNPIFLVAKKTDRFFWGGSLGPRNVGKWKLYRGWHPTQLHGEL